MSELRRYELKCKNRDCETPFFYKDFLRVTHNVGGAAFNWLDVKPHKVTCPFCDQANDYFRDDLIDMGPAQ